MSRLLPTRNLPGIPYLHVNRPSVVGVSVGSHISHHLFWVFNPLSPSIHIQILQTDLHTFPSSPILNPSTSPLKSVFDPSQLSGSINVQDGGTMLFLKTIHGLRSKIRLLCRLVQRSKYFLLGDHFIDSHHLSLCSVWIIVRRKLILDTIGT